MFVWWGLVSSHVNFHHFPVNFPLPWEQASFSHISSVEGDQLIVGELSTSPSQEEAEEDEEGEEEDGEEEQEEVEESMEMDNKHNNKNKNNNENRDSKMTLLINKPNKKGKWSKTRWDEDGSIRGALFEQLGLSTENYIEGERGVAPHLLWVARIAHLGNEEEAAIVERLWKECVQRSKSFFDVCEHKSISPRNERRAKRALQKLFRVSSRGYED